MASNKGSGKIPVRFDADPFRLAPQADEMVEKMVKANPGEAARLRTEFEAVRAVGLWLALKEVIPWAQVEDMLLHWGRNEADAAEIQAQTKPRHALIDVRRKPRKKKLHAQVPPSTHVPTGEKKAMRMIVKALESRDIVTKAESKTLKGMLYGTEPWLNLRKREAVIHPVSNNSTNKFASVPVRKGDGKVKKNLLFEAATTTTRAVKMSADIDDADGDQYALLGSFVIPSGWEAAVVKRRV